MKKRGLLFLIFLIIQVSSIAQTNIFNLFSKKTINNINSLELKTSVSRISSGQILALNTEINNQLYSQKDFYQLAIPTKNGDLVLELEPATITSPDFKVMTPQGEYKMDLPSFYRGKIKGDPKSFVSITVTKNSVEGLIQNDKINLTLGKIKSNKENFHIVYNTNEIQNNTPICAGEVMKQVEVLPDASNKQVSVSTCKTVEIFLEADYQMYLDWGSNATTVTNQMTSIFNNVATLYFNEGVSIVLSSLFVWTTSDPYSSATTTSQSLDLLYNYWQGQGNSFNGDIAHLVSTKTLGGGVAYIIGGDPVFNGMSTRAVFSNCSKQYAKGLSANIKNSVTNIPTFSWNVEVIAHELGHNFGLPHTHSCDWSDGTNIGPIDNCYPSEGGCSPGPTPTAGGTIMSYCHLSSVGINFANGFGDLPGAKMFAELGAANSSCLTGTFVQKPTVRDTVVCASGSLSLLASNCAGTVKWYSSPFGGSSIATGSTFNTPNISSNTNYYVSCTQNSCESRRSKLQVIIFSTITPLGNSEDACGENATSNLSASGCFNLMYKWYPTASGGASLFTGKDFLVSGIVGDTTFYVECSNLNCGSTSRIPVSVTYTPLCPVCIPTGLDCTDFDQIASIKIDSNNVNIFSVIRDCSNSGFELIVPDPSLNLVRDSTYVLKIGNPGIWEDGVVVWIDFDDDNIFENSEVVFSFFNGNLWNEVQTNLVISNTAIIGSHRMRIKTIYGGLSSDPCSASEGQGYGEIVDLMINVICPNSVSYPSVSQSAGTYKVSDFIKSQANVASGTTYQAGKYVQLDPGFQAGGNEVFHAKIAGCQ
ncbi:hypothetical protein EGI22_12960 [Lacihabitans sp. LS3-19]|uniref:Ig-like domain-containing protein n=1 Tax=Lacihabitans sp. LS3-19 TaxID=2487335 RepID=UPI0020CDAA2F|nr:M12 family metallo-peptidase [Lacihabitans sp. LS3-19]MCP9768829.1 hypothetical protein [Lacihabitans sp. LS3-19]